MSDQRDQQGPQSEEARAQGIAGKEGAQARQSEDVGGQNPQGSNRTNAPATRDQDNQGPSGFQAGHAPSEQGEKDHPSPHVIAQHQQGIGRQSGSHAGQTDHSEEIAQSGGPAGEHTRHGRQHTGGNRPERRGED